MSKSSSAGPSAPILITMGEPAGIGPEIAVAAYQALGGQVGAHRLRLIGDRDVFVACGMMDDGALIATKARAGRIPGKPDARNSPAVIEAIEASVELATRGEAA